LQIFSLRRFLLVPAGHLPRTGGTCAPGRPLIVFLVLPASLCALATACTLLPRHALPACCHLPALRFLPSSCVRSAYRHTRARRAFARRSDRHRRNRPFWAFAPRLLSLHLYFAFSCRAARMHLDRPSPQQLVLDQDSRLPAYLCAYLYSLLLHIFFTPFCQYSVLPRIPCRFLFLPALHSSGLHAVLAFRTRLALVLRHVQPAFSYMDSSFFTCRTFLVFLVLNYLPDSFWFCSYLVLCSLLLPSGFYQFHGLHMDSTCTVPFCAGWLVC